MTQRVFVMGAGRAGRALAHAMRVAGVPVVGLHGRRPGVDSTHGALPEPLSTASVILVTVRDEELDAALLELASAPLVPSAVVLHASGSAEPGALEALRAQGHAAGTFHPILPLADPTRAAHALANAWIGIDGDAAARAASRELAAALGARVLEIPAGAKARYHAATVFASNFPVVLLSLATRLLTASGVDAEAARGSLASLIGASADNMRESEPAMALTGPVSRGDVDTVRAHVAALAPFPELLAIYRVLTREALPLAVARGVDPARVDALRRAVDESELTP
jgi:predicted short-subunit dehydrogenase-like oxidoreductase (DUF2520 family)